MSPEKFYFILISYSVLAVRVNVILMLLINGNVRKLFCYLFSNFCKLHKF